MRGDRNQHRPIAPDPAVTPPKTGWSFKTDDAPLAVDEAATIADKPIESVRWTASEFITHQKSLVWYVMLVLSGIVAAGLVYLVTRGDRITTGVIVLAVLLLGYAAARKPRVLQYEVNEKGVTIGSRFYGYDMFKSFSIFHEGAFSGIAFMPLKRFMPRVTLYYSPKEAEAVVGTLSLFLPIEDAHRDLLDEFLERIRF